VERYLKRLQLEQLFKELGASDLKTLVRTVEHFTIKEAEKRNDIVINYFGECGINLIVDTVTRFLLETPRLSLNAKLLDVGAGSGLFTARIAEQVRVVLPDTDFYAMDLTPAMLVLLAKKKAEVTPFIGMAENISDSIKQARVFLKIPYKFDAVFSTLMLHHCAEPEKVFKSLNEVDLCEHNFKEFKTEMGDIHLGFRPEKVCEMARKHFPVVSVEKIRGIRCECSGRSAEIFAATMQNHS
jgi:2-polyprenyl-3-methyl-5-hydroxy-6-metoxy-1,4-benzoquinol methylase